MFEDMKPGRKLTEEEKKHLRELRRDVYENDYWLRANGCELHSEGSSEHGRVWFGMVKVAGPWRRSICSCGHEEVWDTDKGVWVAADPAESKEPEGRCEICGSHNTHKTPWFEGDDDHHSRSRSVCPTHYSLLLDEGDLDQYDSMYDPHIFATVKARWEVELYEKTAHNCEMCGESFAKSIPWYTSSEQLLSTPHDLCIPCREITKSYYCEHMDRYRDMDDPNLLTDAIAAHKAKHDTPPDKWVPKVGDIVRPIPAEFPAMLNPDEEKGNYIGYDFRITNISPAEGNISASRADGAKFHMKGRSCDFVKVNTETGLVAAQPPPPPVCSACGRAEPLADDGMCKNIGSCVVTLGRMRLHHELPPGDPYMVQRRIEDGLCKCNSFDHRCNGMPLPVDIDADFREATRENRLRRMKELVRREGQRYILSGDLPLWRK